MSFGELVRNELSYMYGRIEADHNCDTRNDQATPQVPKITNPFVVRILHGSTHWYFHKSVLSS
jgi:hypothetical protein